MVACGQVHMLALARSGRLYACGKGEFGRLGRGDAADELEFQEVDYFSHACDSVFEPRQGSVAAAGIVVCSRAGSATYPGGGAKAPAHCRVSL